MPSSTNASGYSRISIIVHWIAALAIVILFITHEGERGSTTYLIHVSGGAIAGLFLLWRVWYRVRRGTAEKSAQAAIFNIASKIVIWGFLAAIVIVVITGYFVPWSRGMPLDIFGLISIPSPIAANHTLHEFIEELHEISGQLFLPLIALHILGAAKHAFIDKDGIARRMFKSVAAGR